MGIHVGGPTAYKVKRRGELVIAFHWIGTENGDAEPAMVLFPAVPGEKSGAFILGLSSAYKYADSDTGEPTDYLLKQVIPIANVLGMFATKYLLMAIADAIVDEMPELVGMPPEPGQFELDRRKAEGRMGELTLKSGGQTIAEVQV
jgi:hypothetical protein